MKILITFFQFFLAGLVNLPCASADILFHVSDERVLDRGEISESAKWTGIGVGFLPGIASTAVIYSSQSGKATRSDISVLPLILTPALGLGQLVQGRYLDKGWLVTGGELAAIGSYLALQTHCTSCDQIDANAGAILVGFGLLFASRALEVWDLFFGPADHNRRLNELKRSETFSPTAFIIPTSNGTMLTGVSIPFK